MFNRSMRLLTLSTFLASSFLTVFATTLQNNVLVMNYIGTLGGSNIILQTPSTTNYDVSINLVTNTGATSLSVTLANKTCVADLASDDESVSSSTAGATSTGISSSSILGSSSLISSMGSSSSTGSHSSSISSSGGLASSSSSVMSSPISSIISSSSSPSLSSSIISSSSSSSFSVIPFMYPGLYLPTTYENISNPAFNASYLSYSMSATIFNQDIITTTNVTLFVDSFFGNDANTGLNITNALQSIPVAQMKVRSLLQSFPNANIFVFLNGTFSLNQTWNFTILDGTASSNHINYVTWTSYQPDTMPATVTGGINLSSTNWTLYNSTYNIFRLYVGSGGQTYVPFRNLYVNNVRVPFATAPNSPYPTTSFAVGQQVLDCSGCSLPIITVPTRVEVGMIDEWLFNICQGTWYPNGSIALDVICAENNFFYTSDFFLNFIYSLSNALPFLTQPNTWVSLDDYIYYIPPVGTTSLANFSFLVPQVTTLVDITGTNNVMISSIIFTASSFYQPSTTFGYSEDGTYVNVTCPHGPTSITPAYSIIPAAMSISYSFNIIVMNCTFTHIGGVGLSLDDGTQNAIVWNNLFTDVSGSGFRSFNCISFILTYYGINAFGGAQAPYNYFMANNIQEDNTICYIGLEYKGSAGIDSSYSYYILMKHNTVHDTPYTGIITGGLTQGTTVVNNHVYRFLSVTTDGAGIYSLGRNLYYGANSIHDNSLLTPQTVFSYEDNVGMYFDGPIAGGTSFSTMSYTNVFFNIAASRISGQVTIYQVNPDASYGNIVELPFLVQSMYNLTTPYAGARIVPTSPQQKVMLFGGVFGNGYVNFATGASSCPSTYTVFRVYGNDTMTAPIYFCYRMLYWSKQSVSSALISSSYVFGGMYTNSANNPLIGSMACPTTFTAYQVSNNPIVYACQRSFSNGVDVVGNFMGFSSMGGMLYQTIVMPVHFPNVFTGTQSCPINTLSFTLPITTSIPLVMCFNSSNPFFSSSSSAPISVTSSSTALSSSQASITSSSSPIIPVANWNVSGVPSPLAWNPLSGTFYDVTNNGNTLVLYGSTTGTSFQNDPVHGVVWSQTISQLGGLYYPSIAWPKNVTACMWVNVQSTTDYNVFWSNTAAIGCSVISVFINPGNGQYFYESNYNSNANGGVGNFIPVNEWVFYCMTFNGSSGVGTTYINSVPTVQLVMNISTTELSDWNSIGSCAMTTGFGYLAGSIVGLLSNSLVFNYTATNAQILRLYVAFLGNISLSSSSSTGISSSSSSSSLPINAPLWTVPNVPPPLAWNPLNGTLNDLMNGNTMTLFGATTGYGFVPDPYRGVVWSQPTNNGNGGLVYSSVPWPKNMTVCQWAQITDGGGVNGGYLYSIESNTGGAYFFILYHQDGATYWLEGNYASSNPGTGLGSLVPLNTWMFFCAAFDGISGNGTTYVNGLITVPLPQVQIALTPSQLNDWNTIASYPITVGTTMIGFLSDSFVFNYTLNATQIYSVFLATNISTPHHL